jgi:septation ring formation regulator EzrA
VRRWNVAKVKFGKEFRNGDYVVVDVAEKGMVAIKSAWKRVPGRIHAGSKAYPNRTSGLAAGIDSIVHSDTMLVNSPSGGCATLLLDRRALISGFNP